MTQILLVGIGGFAGSALRYAVSLWISGKASNSSYFPWSTLSVNIAGCFLIGILAGTAVENSWISERARLLLIVGFLGGFTTFSAFSYESLNLLRLGHVGTVVTYVLVTMGITLLVTWLGYAAGKTISS